MSVFLWNNCYTVASFSSKGAYCVLKWTQLKIIMLLSKSVNEKSIPIIGLFIAGIPTYNRFSMECYKFEQES